MNIVSDIDSDNSVSDPCVPPPLKLQQDCDRSESSIKGVKSNAEHLSVDDWHRNLDLSSTRAKAIRVSYHEGPS